VGLPLDSGMGDRRSSLPPFMRPALRILSLVESVLVPLLFVVFVVLYRLDPEYYLSLTKEDRAVEWATFGFLLASGVLGLALAVRLLKTRRGSVLFFGIFGVSCVLFALEEISWGQRIFRILSPEFFLENSSQREINIHNVFQKRSGLKTKHIAGLTLFIYGVCLPWLGAHPKVKGLLTRYGLVVPPRALSFSFLLAAMMMFDWPTGEEEELGELFFSICLFLFVAGEFITRDSEYAARQMGRLGALLGYRESRRS
jgi:hypothetical protein